MFAGQYVDASLTNYFYNDIAVFDLVALRWLPTVIKVQSCYPTHAAHAVP